MAPPAETDVGDADIGAVHRQVRAVLRQADLILKTDVELAARHVDLEQVLDPAPGVRQVHGRHLQPALEAERLDDHSAVGGDGRAARQADHHIVGPLLLGNGRDVDELDLGGPELPPQRLGPVPVLDVDAAVDDLDVLQQRPRQLALRLPLRHVRHELEQVDLAILEAPQRHVGV